jgi:hypothetical protein
MRTFFGRISLPCRMGMCSGVIGQLRILPGSVPNETAPTIFAQSEIGRARRFSMPSIQIRTKLIPRRQNSPLSSRSFQLPESITIWLSPGLAAKNLRRLIKSSTNRTSGVSAPTNTTGHNGSSAPRIRLIPAAILGAPITEKRPRACRETVQCRIFIEISSLFSTLSKKRRSVPQPRMSQ